MYSVLADNGGALKSSYETSSSDSHPNNAGYSALDSSYASFLTSNFSGTTPTPTPPEPPFNDNTVPKPSTGSESNNNYKVNANKIITVPSFNARSHVRAFSTRGNALPSTNFFAFGENFSGGARVRVVRYNSSFTELANFDAYPSAYRIGANIAASDIAGDSVPEILVGPNRSAGLQVKAFSLSGNPISFLPRGFFAYNPLARGGVMAVAGRW